MIYIYKRSYRSRAFTRRVFFNNFMRVPHKSSSFWTQFIWIHIYSYRQRCTWYAFLFFVFRNIFYIILSRGGVWLCARWDAHNIKLRTTDGRAKVVRFYCVRAPTVFRDEIRLSRTRATLGIAIFCVTSENRIRCNGRSVYQFPFSRLCFPYCTRFNFRDTNCVRRRRKLRILNHAAAVQSK